jgi:CO/xanthine dehydrogenase Mo-binding subunit
MSPEAAPSLSQPRRFGSSAGQPLTRRDGVLKVAGRATYAADNHPEGMLYAVTAVSSIARGKVKALDVAAAKSHPGVVEVMTPANRPPLAHDPEEKIPPFGFRVEVLQDGLSFALQEEAITDRRSARIMNADLTEYHVPVNADAPSVEAILIHEDDHHINALGVKGVGEIGVTGTVGAIANAVWHATGLRVRRYPIRIEDVRSQDDGVRRRHVPEQGVP